VTHYPIILADTSLLVAFYNRKDNYHVQVRDFFATCTSRLLTTPICIAETMWLLASDWRVQNQFLIHLGNNVNHFLDIGKVCDKLLPTP
jgi:predicted nucleic acid-binding protein